LESEVPRKNYSLFCSNFARLKNRERNVIEICVKALETENRVTRFYAWRKRFREKTKYRAIECQLLSYLKKVGEKKERHLKELKDLRFFVHFNEYHRFKRYIKTYSSLGKNGITMIDDFDYKEWPLPRCRSHMIKYLMFETANHKLYLNVPFNKGGMIEEKVEYK
jgi:hypothetical protein